MSTSPPTDLQAVLDAEIKYVPPDFPSVCLTFGTDRYFPESGTSVSWLAIPTHGWHGKSTFLTMSWVIDIYFHQKNVLEKEAALNLRDAVLRLRRDGAFVAAPLHRVNVEPIGPHPAGQ